MQEFNQWTKLIALVSILSGVLLSIVPQSKLKSSFKMLCVSILIYTIVFPLSSYDLTQLDFSDLLSMQEELEQEYEEQNERLTQQTSEAALEEVLRQELEENNIEYDEIAVTCTYEGENLVIDGIIIKGDFTNEQGELIADIIEQNIGDLAQLELVGD